MQYIHTYIYILAKKCRDLQLFMEEYDDIFEVHDLNFLSEKRQTTRYISLPSPKFIKMFQDEQDARMPQ